MAKWIPTRWPCVILKYLMNELGFADSISPVMAVSGLLTHRWANSGHLDPRTGAVRQWDSPSGPKSHPYAIAVIDGVVWYNESGMRPDALVRFDPNTEGFQSWAIPSGVGIIRNVWVTQDKNLLIHQSSSKPHWPRAYSPLNV